MSRRWVLFFIAVVLIAWATWLLGQWQFHRLAERKATNAIVKRNEHLAPTPAADLLAPGRPVPAENEWRLVTATGTYDTADTVIVRYRTRDGSTGNDVVVPLDMGNGPALLVDRGWMASDSRGVDVSKVPAPPSGKVTITGWLRVDATGDSTQVSDHSTRAVSSVAIGKALHREVYGGFVALKADAPPAATPLAGPEMPELDNGPHFFYGLQWWFFGVLAIFGFFYLAFDEWRRGRVETPEPTREDAP